MAEMIAMLDGLGAYGQNPIGDVDPNTSTRVYDPKSSADRAITYPPRPYTLGASEEGEGAGGDTDTPPPGGSSVNSGPLGIGLIGGVTIVALVLIAIPLVQKWLGRGQGSMQGAPEMLMGDLGYPEPEMVEFPVRRRRRKAKKSRRSR